MSKRNRRKFQLGQSVSSNSQPVVQPKHTPPHMQHAAEYRIIRNDLIRLFIVNAVFLVAVLLVYYTNRQSNYLEQWYGKLF